MSGGLTGGFFFHPEGTTPAKVAARILSGRINPRLDDVFALALSESRDAHAANAARRLRLLAQLDRIGEELARLDAQRVEIEARLAQQHEVLGKYQEGEDLTDEERDLVTPSCAVAADDEDKVERKAESDQAFEDVRDSLPEGWEKVGHRVEDGFIFVTIKRAVATVMQPKEPVARRVAKALAVFFAPDFDRQGRVQVWNRRASLSPILPGAG